MTTCDERAEQQRVAHRDEVDGAPHERQPHERAVGQHAAELVRVEALQPRPQAVVGRRVRLRLEPDEVLDHRRRRASRTPAQQQLAVEQRAVERACVEDLGAHSPTSASARTGLPVPPTSRSGATTMTAPVTGSCVEVGELREPVAAVSEQVVVDGERRVEAAGGARVDADRLDAEADDVALRRQPARPPPRPGPGVTGPCGPDVEERLGVLRPRAPARAEEHPRAGRASAVLGLEALEVGHREQVAGVLADLAPCGRSHRRADQPLRGDRSDVLAVAAGDPVDRARRGACPCARRARARPTPRPGPRRRSG